MVCATRCSRRRHLPRRRLRHRRRSRRWHQLVRRRRFLLRRRRHILRLRLRIILQLGRHLARRSSRRPARPRSPLLLPHPLPPRFPRLHLLRTRLLSPLRTLLTCLHPFPPPSLVRPLPLRQALIRRLSLPAPRPPPRLLCRRSSQLAQRMLRVPIGSRT